MNYPTNILGSISHEKFLAEYWQKKPLLIKNAIPNFESPIDQDELAGLACAPEAHSRLVIEREPASKKDSDAIWQVKSGPFKEEELSSLPNKNWSLLVQEIDTWVEEVKELKDCFDFIPNWRIDDIMVSFAPDQGSVGPHTDHYDVFLLQGLGKRKWQVGGAPLDNPEIIENIDLKILKHFEPAEEWILEPGDILYLPPEFAHHGVAQGNCMTYSIGFRSPSLMEIMSNFLDSHGESLSERFYADPKLGIQNHPSEISNDAIENVVQILKDLPKDPDQIRHWFGQMVTQSKRDEQSFAAEKRFKNFAEFISRFPKKSILAKNDQLRFAYSCEGKEKVLLFVDGGEYILDLSILDFVKDLCTSKEFSATDLKKLESEHGLGSLILTLYHDGHIVILEDY